MKRLTIITALFLTACMAVLAVTYGPELWAGYKFLKTMDREVAEAEADLGPWPHLQSTCTACHGEQGRARNSQYPSLAGLSESYIEEQLHAFANGYRKNVHMNPIAGTLDDSEIKLLAVYFSRQAPAPNEAVEINAPLRQIAESVITAKGCEGCHGKELNGGALAPRLAGQGEAYLADQLKAFKTGARLDPAQTMNVIAGSLSDEEIVATARVLASQVPANTQGD